jgi:hypothetical protein
VIVKVGGGRRKRRVEKIATVPGMKVRKQIGVERSADVELAMRLQDVTGRLEKLESRAVAEMLADDAEDGSLKAVMLLLSLIGCFENAEDKEARRRFARTGMPRRKRKET